MKLGGGSVGAADARPWIGKPASALRALCVIRFGAEQEAKRKGIDVAGSTRVSADLSRLYCGTVGMRQCLRCSVIFERSGSTRSWRFAFRSLQFSQRKAKTFRQRPPNAIMEYRF